MIAYLTLIIRCWTLSFVQFSCRAQGLRFLVPATVVCNINIIIIAIIIIIINNISVCILTKKLCSITGDDVPNTGTRGGGWRRRQMRWQGSSGLRRNYVYLSSTRAAVVTAAVAVSLPTVTRLPGSRCFLLYGAPKTRLLGTWKTCDVSNATHRRNVRSSLNAQLFLLLLNL